jgi:hypothetical protein
MKYLKVTITNDEEGDEGAITVRMKDAKGNVTSETVVDEGGEGEFEFSEKDSIVISAG